MSINEEKLEMWCKQIDKRLDGLEREVGSIGSITSTLMVNYARESCLPEPKEPLIKDEKIRKAVRAWAEANKINKCKCSDETHCITFETERGMFISFEYAIPIPPEGNFTIAELCGEEEE